MSAGWGLLSAYCGNAQYFYDMTTGRYGKGRTRNGRSRAHGREGSLMNGGGGVVFDMVWSWGQNNSHTRNQAARSGMVMFEESPLPASWRGTWASSRSNGSEENSSY